jgi:hypothetical protein
VDEINARMIDRFLGKATVFYSLDSVDDDERNNYPEDFLNSITPNGLCHTSSESRSVVPLFASIIWTHTVVYAMELVWLSGQSISIY